MPSRKEATEVAAATPGRSTGRISALHVIILGLLLAVAGAVLAFALDDLDAGALDVEALGGIMLATGAVLAVGAAIAVAGGGGGSVGAGSGLADPVNLKSIVGLVAVVTGVVAVTALTIITVAALDDKNSEIAVTSSAFGVISAVVTAYLGIKITAETSGKATEEVKGASEKAAAAKSEIVELQEAITKLSQKSKKELGEKLVEGKESLPGEPSDGGEV
jgi:hypothetical protein